MRPEDHLSSREPARTRSADPSSHGSVRLDGPAAAGIGAPAPGRLDAPTLAAPVREAAPTVTVPAEPVDADDVPRVLA